MNIVTESKLSGKPISDKPHKRPVRLVRWFLIVGLLLAAVVSGLGFFKFVFLPNLFKEIFSKPPPPSSVGFAALTIASTSCVVMSPRTSSITRTRAAESARAVLPAAESVRA